MDNWNYPEGSDTADAPWNQPGDPDPVEVEVIVSYTISKSTTVSVTDYTAEEWEDCERDDDGYLVRTGGINYDFSDCHFKKAYEEGDDYTLPELLDKITEMAEGKLSQLIKCEKAFKDKNLKVPTKVHEMYNHWMKIRNSAINWTEDDCEVIQD